MPTTRFEAAIQRTRMQHRLECLSTILAFLAIPAIAQVDQESDDSAPHADKRGPRIELSTTEWDFGMKWQGQEAQTTISIRNAGDETLVITQIKSSCGCTVPRLHNRKLEPGQSETIHISYNTWKDKPIVHQTVRLFSNDAERPEVAILVKGEVKKALELDPPRGLVLGVLQRDTDLQHIVKIENAYGEPMNLSLDAPQIDGLKFELKEVEAGKRYELIVTTTPPLKGGRLGSTLKLRTGLAEIPAVELRISAFVQPRVEVAPTRLYIPTDSSKPLMRKIQVMFDAAQPIAIREIKTTDPSITAKVAPDRQQSSGKPSGREVIEIIVTLPPGKEFSAGSATILILTNDPEYPELVVPVTHPGEVVEHEKSEDGEDTP